MRKRLVWLWDRVLHRPLSALWREFWTRVRCYVDTYTRWREAGNARWRSFVAAIKAAYNINV